MKNIFVNFLINLSTNAFILFSILFVLFWSIVSISEHSVINIITEKVKRETNIARYQLLVKYSRARFGVSYILVSGQ